MKPKEEKGEWLKISLLSLCLDVSTSRGVVKDRDGPKDAVVRTGALRAAATAPEPKLIEFFDIK